MYAIVEIAGHQFKVEKDQKVFVNRLATEEGKSVSFDNVLLIADGDNITVGAPAIDGAQVSAKVSKHLKGDKVIVFKKKRRKGYRVKNGHRQYLTEIVIGDILTSGAKKTEKSEKAAPKKETKAAAPKAKTTKKASSKGDDLKKVEGIGPKIAETLAEAGITTFAQLAKTDAAKIAEIISDVRGNHVTDTWPAQAQLAADGKWDELKKWQDELDGGKA
ncbi:50S ribosomal protein L21 [Aurantibacter aestuarii]|uniref:Large ribosomal subunit protein bL21 n=1 Tax=Aurantibacter aestuarii TaxID=1266046 RepID=A0A2T1NC98_9FLAO|nr:50S ribosomal protein L21 [Aurantibacter aestuarii]PSG90065.1 50S ribosomal protein L21 [Aurantibacter aestuarii]